jgi:hypothetical protein
MSIVKPETRCRHLAKQMLPLATHVENGFSPAVRRISVRPEDWEMLRQNAEVARAEGFVIDDQGVRYHGIEVASTETAHSRE